MQDIVFIIHILAIVGLILLVLVQHGKGADLGAAFGSGASNTVFGSVGSISFFAKITALLAIIFFVTSIALGVIVAKQTKNSEELVSTTPVEQIPHTPLPIDEG